MNPMNRVVRGHHNSRDRGSAPLEILGAIPVIILVIGLLLQVASVVHATGAANQAARDGARAVSLGSSAYVAVSQSLPGNLEPKSVRTLPSGGVEVKVDAKRVVPFIPAITITRSVVMP